jgi:HEAT repeat protein
MADASPARPVAEARGGDKERSPVRLRVLFSWFVASTLALAPLSAQEPARDAVPPAPHDDEVARLQALAAIPDTAEAERARVRLVELAQALDAARADAAVEALGAFGRHADHALEQVIREGTALSARQRALELRLARRTPAEAAWFAALAVAELPTPLRLLALDGVGNDAVALTLIEGLLRAPEPRLQTRVLRMLSAARRPAAAAFAHEILAPDGRAGVTLQVAAIDALREEKSRAAIERLIDVAGFETGEVRAFALKSLLVMERGGVLLAVMPMMALDAPPERALVAIEVVRRVDLADLPELEAALRAALGHKSLEVRLAAIDALAERHDREALPALERLVLDPEPLLSSAAIRAVTSLRRGEEPWRQRLLQIARSKQPLQRLAAATALAEQDAPAAAPLLLQLAADDWWLVREQAARGLGQIRSVAAIPTLIELVAKDRRRVRTAAAAALRRISAMPFQESERDWRRWWADQPEGFVPPPLAQVVAMEERLASSNARATTHASFYGIAIESEHVAVVVDVSGSMGGSSGSERTKLDVAKDEVAQLLTQLQPGSQANLLFFDDTVHRWRPHLVKLDRRATNESIAFTRSQRAGGSTNLFDALSEALDDPQVDTICLLSDGEPTSGRFIHPAQLRAEIQRRNAGGRVRIHTVSIGLQSALLRHLAADSLGTYVER